jgi:hypothetical protein
MLTEHRSSERSSGQSYEQSLRNRDCSQWSGRIRQCSGTKDGWSREPEMRVVKKAKANIVRFWRDLLFHEGRLQLGSKTKTHDDGKIVKDVDAIQNSLIILGRQSSLNDVNHLRNQVLDLRLHVVAQLPPDGKHLEASAKYERCRPLQTEQRGEGRQTEW